MKTTLALVVPILLMSVSCERQPLPESQPPQPDGDARILAQFELKKTCFEIGRHLYEAQFKATAGKVALKPLYTYSKELNTCVMYVGFVGKKHQATSHFLLDALSNIEIASSVTVGGTTVGLSQDEFERVKSEFFPEVR